MAPCDEIYGIHDTCYNVLEETVAPSSEHDNSNATFPDNIDLNEKFCKTV